MRKKILAKPSLPPTVQHKLLYVKFYPMQSQKHFLVIPKTLGGISPVLVDFSYLTIFSSIWDSQLLFSLGIISVL